VLGARQEKKLMNRRSDQTGRSQSVPQTLTERVRFFLAKPTWEKYFTIARRVRLLFPQATIPFRLSFGAWWLAEHSALDCALLAGDFEGSELHFVGRFLQPGMTVLDVGAHHGLYTLLASKKVGPAGKVIAFEPSARERKRLQRHVRLNFSSNVRIEPCGLGSRHSQEQLFVVEGAEDWCNSLRPPAVGASTRSESVNILPLDDYLAQSHIARVDFWKLDVEGAELEILKGATLLLNRPFRPAILAEVQDIRTEPWGYRAREIIQFLHRQTYDWFQLLPGGGLARLEADRENYDANFVAIPRERAKEILQRLEERCDARC
jgi:FkbM family methyltransferase